MLLAYWATVPSASSSNGSQHQGFFPGTDNEPTSAPQPIPCAPKHWHIPVLGDSYLYHQACKMCLLFGPLQGPWRPPGLRDWLSLQLLRNITRDSSSARPTNSWEAQYFPKNLHYETCKWSWTTLRSSEIKMEMSLVGWSSLLAFPCVSFFFAMICRVANIEQYHTIFILVNTKALSYIYPYIYHEIVRS